MVRLAGIEPAHPAPEAGALSPELQAHLYIHSQGYYSIISKSVIIARVFIYHIVILLLEI